MTSIDQLPRPAARRGWVRAAGWVRVSHGVYRPRLGEPGLAEDLHGWQFVLPPSGSFTHLTGAILRGWWVPPLPAALPVFAGMSQREARPRRAGLLVCRHPGDIPSEEQAGLRVATATEILLAAGRDLGLLDMVVLTDAALHVGDCTMPELRQASSRRRGAPALRRALRYADGRSESAWESVLRLLHQLCGVPVVPQFPILDGEGVARARADLWIEGTRRLPEYDGAVHRNGKQHTRDLARERFLLTQGWQRYGYTSPVLLHNGLSVLRDADEALGRAHEPARIRPWHAALAESLFTPAGTGRLLARWAD
ncbi:MAG: hypothetical protein ACR2KO_13095 [Geodermatophilaceae bacterium]